MVEEGQLLWEPREEWLAEANVTAFRNWVNETRNLALKDHDELRQWSVDQLEDFWAAIWEYFDVQSSAPYECVLKKKSMPGAEWFPGARLNYAEHIFRNYQEDKTALMFRIEDSELTPSARVLREMREQDIPFFRLAMNYSEEWATHFRRRSLSPEIQSEFESERERSLAAQAALEQDHSTSFEDYLQTFYDQYKAL